jgi:hypothetical protein
LIGFRNPQHPKKMMLLWFPVPRPGENQLGHRPAGNNRIDFVRLVARNAVILPINWTEIGL